MDEPKSAVSRAQVAQVMVFWWDWWFSEVKFRKQLLEKIDRTDTGEVSGPEVQLGAWTACLRLDAGVGTGGRKGSFFLLCFLGQSWASELVTGLGGSAQRPSPRPSSSRWNQGKGSATGPLEWGPETQGVEWWWNLSIVPSSSGFKSSLFHPEAWRWLVALDLPQSYFLTCRMERMMPSGFSQGFS